MRANRALALGFLLIATVGAHAQAPPGAALCSGCHAPAVVGSPVPPLAGRNADDMFAAMAEYRAGKRDGTIMPRIAKGFSDDETRAIVTWLSRQKP